MTQLSASEITTRAAQFTARWSDDDQENAEAQTFWNEFLQIWGIDRRRVAQFERRVDGLPTASGRGRVDLLWPGLFMAEHKSRGRDLRAAVDQALEYVQVLEDHERPQWIAVSDFEKILLHNVESQSSETFPLSRLPHLTERFNFLIGRELRRQIPSDPVNIHAAEQMGKLHDLLERAGYTGHALELLLVRLLFLLFGDDTGLWDERGLFYDALADHTRSDGENLGGMLGSLFQTLDTPRERRQKTLPAYLDAFPYVNGELFSERIDLANFSPRMREMLLAACVLDWGQVSPAIFGSMFQTVMDPTERRNLGAHYTSEANIIKALGPLFLDDLKAQREAARGNTRKLEALRDLLPKLRFLDPACGSGNFLLLAYRELRRLELSILVELQNKRQVLDIKLLLRVNIGQFYGIEYDEFAAQIARVALWLVDHQMNIEASQQLGQSFVNLPLTHSAHIRYGDALAVDWNEHLNVDEDGENLRAVYIVGNPPFVGYNLMDEAQHEQIKLLFEGVNNAGRLDFVSGWYAIAARTMSEMHRTWPQLKVATSLVSTNSITQGEQVAPIWGTVIDNHGHAITSAHQTFKWSNDAPGQAAVHCVIMQFEPADQAPARRRLFTYATLTAQPEEHEARNINAYLVDAPHVLVGRVQNPLRSGIPPMKFGSMPRDGGHLIIQNRADLETLLRDEPGAERYVKQLLDAQDFLNGGMRWCLWLKDVPAAEIRKLPAVMDRIEKVRKFRLASKAKSTRDFGQTPAIFAQLAHEDVDYLAVPRVSSERREYIPIGYLDGQTVINDAMFLVPNADIFHFGVMQSRLHMDWMRAVSGRLKSDYRYAKDLTYNSFPWLDRNALKPAQVQAVTQAAQMVLDARETEDGTLADLYDPITMPSKLRKAHNALDRAVEACYGMPASLDASQRLSRLLILFQDLSPSLNMGGPASKVKRTPRTRKEAREL